MQISLEAMNERAYSTFAVISRRNILSACMTSKLVIPYVGVHIPLSLATGPPSALTREAAILAP